MDHISAKSAAIVLKIGSLPGVGVRRKSTKFQLDWLRLGGHSAAAAAAAALIWKVASLESRSRSREIPARSGESVEFAFSLCFWRNNAPVHVRTYAAHEILQNDALDAIVAAHREENESDEVWLKVYLKEHFKRNM